MKPICLGVLSALTVMAAGATGPAEQQKDDKKVKADDQKLVRRIWFPRFSPDGSLVLAAHGGWEKNQGGEARLLAAKDGAVKHVFPHPRGVRTVAWSPKGTFFVTGGYGFGIRGYDVKGPAVLRPGNLPSRPAVGSVKRVRGVRICR